MKFTATEIADVFEIELEPHSDERGFFARAFCVDEAARAGIGFAPVQVNLSRNTAQHTLRGMHYQNAPFAEAKIVRVTSGAIFDVAVDIREASSTRGKWVSRVLDARRGNALLIPEGFAHGFLTLQPETDVLYLMERAAISGHACGFAYDDVSVAIAWPFRPQIVSERDKALPKFSVIQTRRAAFRTPRNWTI